MLRQGARTWHGPPHRDLVLAALLLLSLRSLGIPPTLVLLGGWLLAAALSRWAPGLAGPASWAAAVVLEVGLLTAEDMLVAAISPHAHGRAVALVVLALPVGLAVFLLRLRPDRVRQDAPSRWGVAATVTGVGLVLPMWVRSRGTDYGVAWAASGDARNHAVLVRQILHSGGLTTAQLRGYPAVMDGLTALLSGAGRRAGLPSGRLMVHDLEAMAATYVLSGIAIAALIVAALHELLPTADGDDDRRRLPAPVAVVLLVAAWTAASPLVLGTSLLDGYLTAYATLPLVLASVVLAMRSCRAPSPAAYGLLGPAAVLVFLSWTLVAVGPVLLVGVAGLVLAIRAALGPRTRPPVTTVAAWSLAGTVSVGCAVVLAAITDAHVAQLHYQFLAPGSVTPPWHGVLVLLLVLICGCLALAPSAGQRRALLPPLTVAAAGLATVRFLVWLSPDGRTWTYYAGKTLALTAAVLVWVVFAPVLLLVSHRRVLAGAGRGRPTVLGALAGAASIALVVALGTTTDVRHKLGRAGSGWKQPSAAVLAEDARLADAGHPFLLWHWSNGGDDRLGNFWAALTWSYDAGQLPVPYGPSLPGGFAYWAYVEKGGIHDLCQAATGVHDLYVVTRLTDLRAQLAKHCGGTGAHVLVETPPPADVTPAARRTSGQ